MCWFGDGHGVEIGDYSNIGIRCYIPNDIKLGEKEKMEPCRYLLGRVTHNYSDVTKPMILQGMQQLPGITIIGDDVWIGRQVLILSGINIGSHSIRGAGSVVTKDIPPFYVVAGNPAQIKKIR